MGLKGAGPYLQRSILNKVLNGLVYEICEIYIDGKSDPEFLDNTRRVFDRLRDKNVAIEYVGHIISATGTSFTPEKRLKIPTLDYAICDYIYMVTNGKVRVLRRW